MNDFSSDVSANRKKTRDELTPAQKIDRQASADGESGAAITSLSRHCSVLAVITLIIFGSGCATRPTEYREPLPLTAFERTASNLQVFERAWELVNRKYFDARFRGVDWLAMREKYRPAAIAAADEATLYQILNHLCGELKESHLAAISPRRAHEYSTQHRASVGFRWQFLEGRRVVSDIVPGSPASVAGIQPGWLVLTRNGAPVNETDGYLPKLGRPVTYGFMDAQDEPRTLTMEPQLLNFDLLESRNLSDDYHYLRFDVFDHKSLSWLSEQLKTHATATGVVIDLRNNSGGNLLALNIALAEFFPEQVASGRMIKRSGRETESKSFAWLSARYAGRVAILTDRTTASAAEIFSHVLQYHKRAVVVGRQTAGAVIASRNYALPGGGRLQVPVTDFVGLHGQRLEGRGVTPNLVCPDRTIADWRTGNDPDLTAAVRALRETEQQKSRSDN